MMSFFHKNSSNKKHQNNNTDTSTTEMDTSQMQSSSSSIDTTLPYSSSHNTSSSLQPAASKPLVTAAKPKKGILKTMSKFTMGAHLPSHSTQQLKQTENVQQQQQTPMKPPAAQMMPMMGGEQNTIRFKHVPLYLSVVHQGCTNGGGGGSSNTSGFLADLEASLARTVEVAVNKLSLINLSPDERNDPYGPIYIEANELAQFLPGDQLIAVEDYSMLGNFWGSFLLKIEDILQ
jgi:hypothetical protein